MTTPITQRNGLAIILALGAVTVLWLLVQPGKPQPNVELLAFPTLQPKSYPHWKRKLYVMVDRLKSWVLGPGKTVILDFHIYTVNNPSSLTNLTLPRTPFSDTQGLRVWIPTEEALGVITRDLGRTPGITSISRPRISTKSGIQASLFAGETVLIGGSNRESGVSLDCLVRTAATAYHFESNLSFMEAITNRVENTEKETISIRTNLAVASRILIPKGNAVILMDTNGRKDGIMSLVTLSVSEK